MPRLGSSPDHVEYGIRRKRDVYQVRIAGLTTTARTLTEARKARSYLEQQAAESFGQGSSREKLGAYLTRWLEVVRVTRKQGTYKAWEPVVRLRLKPHRVGKLGLCDLRPEDIQRWVIDMSRVGVSGRTQHKYYECLSASLNDAVDQRLIPRSPLVGIRKPAQEHYVPTVWNGQQMRTFLAAAECDQSRYVQVLRFIAYVGCRVSDACTALESDVDLERRTILIRKGKTEAAWRDLPLIPECLTFLRTLAEMQKRESWYWEEQYKLCPRWLFRCQDGRKLEPRSIERALHRVAAANGLPDCRVHDLRHAFATNGLRAGVDRRLLGRALGHANEAMTGHYQHVDDPMLHAAVEAVADTWRGSNDIDLTAILERNPETPDIALLAAEVQRLRNLIGPGMAQGWKKQA